MLQLGNTLGADSDNIAAVLLFIFIIDFNSFHLPILTYSF